MKFQFVPIRIWQEAPNIKCERISVTLIICTQERSTPVVWPPRLYAQNPPKLGGAEKLWAYCRVFFFNSEPPQSCRVDLDYSNLAPKFPELALQIVESIDFGALWPDRDPLAPPPQRLKEADSPETETFLLNVS